MPEDCAGQDYLTKSLALAAENREIEQQIALLSEAIQLGLPLLEKTIAHAFLMRCYAHKESLEEAQKELATARELLGMFIGFRGEELAQFVQQPWYERRSEDEERIIAFLQDKAKHQPWYWLLFDIDEGLFDLYLTAVDSLEDATQQAKRAVKLHDMKLYPPIDFLRFFLAYRYFEQGEVERAIIELQRVVQGEQELRKSWLSLVRAVKEPNRAIIEFHKVMLEAKSVSVDHYNRLRFFLYDPQCPLYCEYGIALRTVLGLDYKEQGNLERAIEQWQIAVQADQVWLKEVCEGAPFYAPVVDFWLDRARQLLRGGQ